MAFADVTSGLVFGRYAVSRSGTPAAGSRPGSGFANVPAQVTPDVADTGRKPSMPQGHVILVMGQSQILISHKESRA